MSDGYGAAGEFIDLFSAPAWQALREPVTAALAGAPADRGPVLDVGAGTGLSTLVLAEACPVARLVAAEPSAVLRAVLLSRVAAAADLRERTTVEAAGALELRLPESLGGVLAANMIGHLSAAERAEFLRRVAERLAPGAPLVVNLQQPAEVTRIAPTTFARVRVGRHTYEGSGGAEPAGPDSVTWRMRYRIRDEHGATVDDRSVDYPWYIVPPALLLAELAEAGLVAEVGPLDVVRAVRPT